jgi:hypothetical protein
VSEFLEECEYHYQFGPPVSSLSGNRVFSYAHKNIAFFASVLRSFSAEESKLGSLMGFLSKRNQSAPPQNSCP